jgi:glutamate--cysteine ligase
MNDHLIQQVPHLTTALTGPFQQLERHLLDNQVQIEAWLRKQWQITPPPFYCSVDLRNASYKIAPVDTNLFPAGFNNLNPDFIPLSIQATQSTLDKIFPGCLRVLLIPENHTRNINYFENIAMLIDILNKSGLHVRIGSLLEDLKEAQSIKLPSGRTLLLEPVTREGNRVSVKRFSPCLIILNNDLSEGVPAILQGIEQTIIPALKLGWSQRLKSTHFGHYKKISEEFAELIQIDPWLINPIFSRCSDVNFLKREGEEALMDEVDKVLTAVKQKYNEYGITHKPFVVVKAESGTYGMGVLMVNDASEISSLNRKERSRMATSKGKKPITQVIIQEGVYTFETWGEEQAVAEPVVYMIGQYVVGGFYRVHMGRGVSDNLNSPGMEFKPLAFVDCCNNPDRSAHPKEHVNRFYTYGVIARLALLAAAREAKE